MHKLMCVKAWLASPKGKWLYHLLNPWRWRRLPPPQNVLATYSMLLTLKCFKNSLKSHERLYHVLPCSHLRIYSLRSIHWNQFSLLSFQHQHHHKHIRHIHECFLWACNYDQYHLLIAFLKQRGVIEVCIPKEAKLPKPVKVTGMLKRIYCICVLLDTF